MEFKGKVEPAMWKAREEQLGEQVSPRGKHVVEEEEVHYDNPFELRIKYGNHHRLIPNAPMLHNGR